MGWPGVMLVADVLFGSPVMAMVIGTVVAVLGVYVFTREITTTTPWRSSAHS